MDSSSSAAVMHHGAMGTSPDTFLKLCLLWTAIHRTNMLPEVRKSVTLNLLRNLGNTSKNLDRSLGNGIGNMSLFAAILVTFSKRFLLRCSRRKGDEIKRRYSAI